MDLKSLVIKHIEDVGFDAASTFFGLSKGTITNWVKGRTPPTLAAAEMVLSLGKYSHSPGTQEERELKQWKGRNVQILQPVYRSLAPETHFTLFANYAKYGPEKIGLIYEKRTVIHECRNILAHKFLKTDAEYAIMPDDDMIMPMGNAAIFNERYGASVSTELASQNAISRIMSHPKERKIVGALYFGRHKAGKAQCSIGFTNETENQRLKQGTYKGLVPVDWVGTGFIRIHRSVFEEMQAAIDGGKWPECKPPEPGSWYGFFNPIRVRMGEDVSFCIRAKELGIQSYVDAGLVCLHTGECHYGPANVQ